jgi:2-amino-4-hydroxy-6-hydroxymethyldihydropteridine diphosphokinase
MPESRREPSTAAIALGSNLPSSFGSREATLQAAILRLAELGEITAISSFFDTEPVGYTDQPRFLNAALLLDTELPALDLLRALLSIEQSMGRRREGVPAKGPRVIDLDLIWLDGQVIESPELTLPHPALPDRTFVLEPLAEIAPDWVHPVLRLSVREMLTRLQRPKVTGC